MSSPLKIGVLAEARYLVQNQPTGLYRELQNRGHEITLIDPQKSFYVMGDDRWFEGLDALVARGRSWALLGLLGWAETRRMRTINSRNAIASVHNKPQMSIPFSPPSPPFPKPYFASTH